MDYIGAAFPLAEKGTAIVPRREPQVSAALKIMFVDDDPEVLKLFKALVEPLGCEVVTFADSREAAQRVQKEKFDGVFVDASMPHPDGFELAQIIRHSPSNFATPIVMLTGYDDAETMRKGFQAGVTSFIGKPLSQSRLAKLLTAMRGAMLREKKRYVRLPFKTPVTWRVGKQVFKSQSLNISETGMMLEKSGGATVGQELDLEFRIPQSSDPLKPHAKVIRKEPPDRIAVQFVGLKSNELETIQRFISEIIKE